MVDCHDQPESRQDVSAQLPGEAEFLTKEQSERHLIDHDGEIDNQKHQIIFLLLGNEHILKDMDDIDFDLFERIQQLIGLWQSEENKEQIDAA